MSRGEAKAAPVPDVAGPPLGPAGRYDHPVAARTIATMKRHAGMTRCCGSVVLPGLFVRLYMARKLGEEVRRAERDALADCATALAEEGFPEAARLVRRWARATKVRA